MEPNIKVLTDWIKKRDETIATLNNLADYLDRKYKTLDKVGVVGATARVVATGSALLGWSPAIPGAIAGLAKIGTREGGKYFSDEVIKQTQELFDKDAESCVVIKDTMTQLCEVEIGIYKQFSQHIKETANCGGTKMPELNKKEFETSHLKGNNGGKDLAVAAGTSKLLHNPVVQQGMKALQEQNEESVQKVLKMCLEENREADKGPGRIVREIIKFAKQFECSSLLTPQAAVKLADYARYFRIIPSFPFQIKDLYDSVVKDGSEQKIPNALRQKVKEMQKETKEIERHVISIVTDLSNLVLFINYIKKKGSDDFLDTVLNMILKEINKARNVIETLKELHHEETHLEKVETFETISINCEGISGNPIKELMMWIWCAWKLKSGAIMFLQNTHFTHVPGFWTIFGYSVNCFGSETNRGVSILLPHDFNGAVEECHEFKDQADPKSDWNGRCLVANVKYKHEQFTLVNMIAPAERNDREIFIREAAKFVSRNATATQQIVASVNFAPNIPTMTVRIPNKVSSSIKFSVIQKFIPSQPVSEYLVKSMYGRKRDRDTLPAQIYVDSVCDSLNLNMSGCINWFYCEKPMLDEEDYTDQIKVFLNLGLTDIWAAKNSGFVEFSSVKEIADRTVTMTRTVHFLVSNRLVEKNRFCQFDHIPRILGFTEHSPLTFAVKNQQ